MRDAAITVDGLGKRYRLGQRAQLASSFREALMNVVTAPARRLRRLGEAPDVADAFWALRDVSFDVARGEVMGIIGSNGAGKSTLLKILSRITDPTEGEARVRGRVGSLLEVGTGFHPELTGRENVFLSGAILGMRKQEIERRFDEIVAFAEIEQFLDTPVKRYSSGMYVRLAFAVAAHLDPEILIIDEVLAVGDSAFQRKCLGKMREASEGDGRTVLFVSHNLDLVTALCTRAIVLAEGRILYSGAVRDAIHAYASQSFRSGEILRATSPKLEWLGLEDRPSICGLSPDSDIEFRLGFRSGDVDLEKLHVDCELVNQRGEVVSHSKSHYVGEGLSIGRRSDAVVLYRLRSPKLAPGDYRLTVYAYDESGELVWIEGVEACTISARAYFGQVEVFDALNGAIIPEFSLEVASERPSSLRIDEIPVARELVDRGGRDV